jgi:hypothetical protein
MTRIPFQFTPVAAACAVLTMELLDPGYLANYLRALDAARGQHLKGQ